MISVGGGPETPNFDGGGPPSPGGMGIGMPGGQYSVSESVVSCRRLPLTSSLNSREDQCRIDLRRRPRNSCRISQREVHSTHYRPTHRKTLACSLIKLNSIIRTTKWLAKLMTRCTVKAEGENSSTVIWEEEEEGW